MSRECKVCGVGIESWFGRCDEHKRCDGCGTRQYIVLRSSGVWCDPCHRERVEARVAAFKGDHEFTANIVCPYCGEEHGDSWEYSEGETECVECERRFDMVRVVEVSYVTSKLPEGN